MKYVAILEKGEHNYSAYVPDLPGCISTGDSLEEAKQMIREALKAHINAMRKDGDPLPEPSTRATEVEVG